MRVVDPTTNQPEGDQPPPARALVVGNFTGEAPTSTGGDPILVTRDNLAAVLRELGPRLSFVVPNCLTDDGGSLAVEIVLDCAPDQWPARIVEQVEPLRQLAEVRRALLQLKARVRRNPQLAAHLNKLLQGGPEALKAALGAYACEDGPIPTLTGVPS
jgi:type VI secretion system protein ImpB